jgi:hypothetical protein
LLARVSVACVTFDDTGYTGSTVDPAARSVRLAAASVVVASAVVAAGCAGVAGSRLPSGAAEANEPRGLRTRGLTAREDPTVYGARVLPASLQVGRFWGAEPAGGSRVLVGGVRLLVAPDGTLSIADDRFAASPASVVALPERMGGGFLFAVNRSQGPTQGTLWHADRWLGAATPIVSSHLPIGPVLVGLDRVYLRYPQGRLAAIDPRSGAPLNLGPLPAAPRFGRLAALDAWRALAVADGQGVLLTADAGSTWQAASLPADPADVMPVDDAFVVAVDAATLPDTMRRIPWWRVRRDGQVEPLDAPPAFLGRPFDEAPLVAVHRDAAARVFGAWPLVAAVEDGWPLSDGTALLARDGMLARVRLDDGALVEAVSGAFPLSPARCHPVPLPRAAARGAFGFVCGEPRGPTRIYRYDPGTARMLELRRFDEPRAVGASGGGLAVAGGCAPADEPSAAERPQTGPSAGEGAWCVMSPGGEWSEVRIAARDADRAQLLTLSDGRRAVLHPPRAGVLESAHVTIGAVGGRPADVPVRFPTLSPDIARIVGLGTWMNGFEERRPGVIGGWIDAGGSVVGVEIALDGEGRAGEYIREAGQLVVSGRWALGWTASRLGFETTDGGMSWSKGISLPEPIAEPVAGRARACGPIGCVEAGWVRLGWGGEPPAAPDPPPPRGFVAARTPRPWHLRCDALAPRPPATAPASGSDARAPVVPAQGLSSTQPGTVYEFPPFSGRAAGMPADAAGVTVEANLAAARVYAWGPRGGDWDVAGRWQVRWDWPWGGWPDARGSSVSPVPWPSIEAARRALGVGGNAPVSWVLVPGDDADHALLVARRAGAPATAELLVLDADRPPVWVKPVKAGAGDSFPEVDSAVRAGGRWYVMSTIAASTALWEVDGGTARELRRIPRAGLDGRNDGHGRLARRDDGRAIGVVVDGQPDVSAPPSRWVLPVEVPSGVAGDPEPLATLGGAQQAPRLCTGDDTGGWELGIEYAGAIELEVGDGWTASLQSPIVEVRLARDRACIERVLGSANPYGATAPAALMTPGAAAAVPSGEGRTRGVAAGSVRTVDVSVFSARLRYPLRCWPHGS